ncbi:MAG: GspE/PulE family protein [Candidatus Sumerlaeaceae bacterium]|nr:GspE/PulE family protein [Candidatus Sumerlaeaceae bacterium]
MRSHATYPTAGDGTRAALPEALKAEFQRLITQGELAIPELADAILESADKLGASDVHIEPGRDAWAVRYRLEGILVPVADIPKALGENLIGRFKMMARVLTYRRRAPQDGRVDVGGIGVRAAFMPTLHGEKAVLRLPVTDAPLYLKDLGMSECDRINLERILLGGHGVLFLTGPASSGKSTTIYAALRFILDRLAHPPNIATLEDPIEQELPGVNQTQIDPAGGLTFATGLRTILRMDPDVIVVGEIRDEETARIAIHAGLSGHRVLTTIHSGTAAQVYARLLHMGIEPFLLASAVTGICAQRLARRVCPECAHPRLVEAWEARLLLGEELPELIGVSANGCAACRGIGARGRFALFELALPTAEVREAVLQRATASHIAELLVVAGMRPLAHALRDEVLAHHISIEEAIRLRGGIVSDQKA